MPLQDDITMGLIIGNIILTIVLLSIYYKNHRAIRSKLTFGLMFFAIAFLVENLLNLFFYSSLLSQSIFGVTTFHFAVNLLEMVGLLILLYVTWK